MKIGNKELDEIIGNVEGTLNQTRQIIGLESTCHFVHMVGNLIQNLVYANILMEKNKSKKNYYKKGVLEELREINEYFIALGTNEAFRNYEFIPDLKLYKRTKKGLVGYTQMILPEFQ